jgi:DNA-binding MarR family transcriptional regulator
MMDDDAVDQVVDLLPGIGRLLFMTAARYPCVAGRSFAQIKTLVHLHHHGECTVSELAAACGVSLSAASEVADRLVEEGMIIRTANPDDRRQVLLRPSETALRVGAEIRALRSRQVRSMLDRLDPEHQLAVVPVLEALFNTLDEDIAVRTRQTHCEHADIGAIPGE